jgi:hypothetical protein
MAGNVWQWTLDWYRPDPQVRGVVNDPHAHDVLTDPHGPASSFDPSEPTVPKRVIKGGSYLCSEAYCDSYRPSARRGAAPDTGSSHVGFRCVRDP